MCLGWYKGWAAEKNARVISVRAKEKGFAEAMCGGGVEKPGTGGSFSRRHVVRIVTPLLGRRRLTNRGGIVKEKKRGVGEKKGVFVMWKGE